MKGSNGVPCRTCCPKWDNGKIKDEYPMSNTQFPMMKGLKRKKAEE